MNVGLVDKEVIAGRAAGKDGIRKRVDARAGLNLACRRVGGKA